MKKILTQEIIDKSGKQPSLTFTPPASLVTKDVSSWKTLPSQNT